MFPLLPLVITVKPLLADTLGTSLSVRLIEGVRLIGGTLNSVFTVSHLQELAVFAYFYLQ